MWTPTKMVASPPSQRCRSSIQAGRGRWPNGRVLLEMARPHSTEALSRAQAISPAERAMYQGRVPLMARPPWVAPAPGRSRRGQVHGSTLVAHGSSADPPSLRGSWESVGRRPHSAPTRSGRDHAPGPEPRGVAPGGRSWDRSRRQAAERSGGGQSPGPARWAPSNVAEPWSPAASRPTRLCGRRGRRRAAGAWLAARARPWRRPPTGSTSRDARPGRRRWSPAGGRGLATWDRSSRSWPLRSGRPGWGRVPARPSGWGLMGPPSSTPLGTPSGSAGNSLGLRSGATASPATPAGGAGV